MAMKVFLDEMILLPSAVELIVKLKDSGPIEEVKVFGKGKYKFNKN